MTGQIILIFFPSKWYGLEAWVWRLEAPPRPLPLNPGATATVKSVESITYLRLKIIAKVNLKLTIGIQDIQTVNQTNRKGRIADHSWPGIKTDLSYFKELSLLY